MRSATLREVNAAAWAVAVAVAGAIWLRQAIVEPLTALSFVEQTLFLAAAAHALSQLAAGVAAQWRRVTDARRTGAARGGGAPSLALSGPRLHPYPLGAPSRLCRSPRPTTGSRWIGVGVAALGLLVLVQTVTHLDDRAPYLYMTTPPFPVGAGTGADGYLVWLEGHPVYEESWQFAQQTAVYTGADASLTTGDHDARAAYSYLNALLAPPMGYFGAFVVLNACWWLAAALATWYLAHTLLGREPVAFAAGALTASGQGFVFMAGTPMSYVAGYAWAAILLALAARWQLFGWRSSGTRWLMWGWVCGVSGLFYFTHVVTIAVAWVFGLRRTPLRSLAAATAVALAVPALWFLVGHYVVGLGFKDVTAQDLARSVRQLTATALATPLRLPAAAGDQSVHALVGGYYYLVLALALVGTATAAPRRRQWYLAVAVCGLGPAFILHMLPPPHLTQRYGYLAYPAIHVAAAEGAWLAGRWAWRIGRRFARLGDGRAWQVAVAAGLVLVQLVQANADLAGVYRFALAFGGP